MLYFNQIKIYCICLITFLFSIISLSANSDEDSLLVLLSQTKIDTAIIDIYINLGHSTFNTDLKKTENYYEEALNISVKQNDVVRQAIAYGWIAYLYYYKGDYKQSLENYYKKLELAIALNDKIGEANVLNNIAQIHSIKGDNEKYLSNLLKAVKIWEEENAQENLIPGLINLGSYYYDEGQLDRALEHVQRARKISLETDNEEYLGVILNTLGSLFEEFKQYENAAEYYNKALEIRRVKNDVKGIIACLNNIGYLHYKQESYKKAISFYEQTKQLAFENNLESNKAYIYLLIGRANVKMNNTKEATRNLKLSYQSAESIGNKVEMTNAAEELYAAYAKAKNYTEAYKYQAIFLEMYQESSEDNKTNAIAEMETKYRTAKKEKENDLLKVEQQLDKAELDKKSTQQLMMLVVIGLILLVVVYVLYSLTQKKKTNKLLNVQNAEISLKNDIIEEKNKDITDSINYAQRIQNAILPSTSILQNNFESFIYYKPKDIVSGDFYWVKEIGNKVFFAVVDCTGHGVPGAFMSIIGYHSLNKIVEDLKLEKSGEILDALNKEVNKSLGLKEGKEISIRDGMDISICCIDKNENTLTYSGANNSLYLLRKKQHTLVGLEVILENESTSFYEIKPNKMAIGGGDNQKSYQTHTFNLEKGDTIYLFSDGYADQFGGEKGKKFKYKPFKKMLLSFQEQSMEHQLAFMNKVMIDWMGDIEQLDDICVMGVRV